MNAARALFYGSQGARVTVLWCDLTDGERQWWTDRAEAARYLATLKRMNRKTRPTSPR